MKILPYGDTALLVQFEKVICPEVHLKVLRLAESLRAYARKGVINTQVAYNSLTIFFSPKMTSTADLMDLVFDLAEEKQDIDIVSDLVEIPVCYESAFALDQKVVQQETQLTWSEIVEKHTQVDYLVYMIGFVPGFMYLGGLDPALFMPRKEIPRTIVPQGSLAMAAQQTGLYPFETPGGWQIIGRTPIELFNFQNPLVKPGDKVRFVPVSSREFNQYKKHKNV